MAAPAAAAAVPIAQEAANTAKDLAAAGAREFLAWARQPFYADQRTTVRSWTEIDKKGKVHTLTETKVRGFAVSNGTVLGMVALAALWEVGLAACKAFNTAVSDAIDIIEAPLIIAYDETNAVVGTAYSIGVSGSPALLAAGPVGQAAYVWDWLDGRGPSNSSPPPTAVKTVTLPATAMAAHNQFLAQLFNPGAVIGQALNQKLAQAIQNPWTPPKV